MDVLTPGMTAWPTALYPALRHVWSRTLFVGKSATPEKPKLLSLFVLLVLPALLLYPCLNFRLLEPDEGRYAEIPREMLARGDWVVPMLQGEPYLDKPPLLYWLVMVSYQMFGVHDWVARIPTAMAVHGTIFTVYLFGCGMFGQRRALRGSLLLSVMPGLVGIGRLLNLDGLLTLWITIGLFAGFRFMQTDRPRWAFVLWTTACGLGVLTKGPIAVVLVVTPLLIWRWLNPSETKHSSDTLVSPNPSSTPKGSQPLAPGRTSRTRGYDEPRIDDPEGVAAPWNRPRRCDPSGIEEIDIVPSTGGIAALNHRLMAATPPGSKHDNESLIGAKSVGMRAWLLFFFGIFAINLPWYIAISLREPNFVKYFFWQHNLQRFLTPFDHLQPIWYYGPIMLGCLFPVVLWAIPILRCLVSGDATLAARRSSELSFCLIAGGFCVTFFSLSGCKLPTYILPSLPPLALALGVLLETDKRLLTRAQWTVGCIWVAMMIAGHWAVMPMYAHERSPMREANLVQQLCGDPAVKVHCFPRQCNSASFYLGRDDMSATRTKNIGDVINDCYTRPRTVIMFTHRHSMEAFAQAIPPHLNMKLLPLADFRRSDRGSIMDKVLGGGPWGLSAIAAVEKVGSQP